MQVYPAGGGATGGSRYDITVSGGDTEGAGITCIHELLASFVFTGLLLIVSECTSALFL